MIKNVYSVRDCKSGFGPLMLQDMTQLLCVPFLLPFVRLTV